MSDWRFELDEVGEDAEPADDPVEAGSPSLENAAFVVLGVATALAVFAIVVLG